jgi:lipopolysaccharide export system protein LptA
MNHIFKIFVIIFFLSSGISYAATGKSKHDNSQPIEITADSLSVDQKSGNATFTGNVDAKQGDVRIRSQKMVVTYSSSKTPAKAVDAAATATPQPSSQPSAISKVTLFGDITITSGDDIAQGQHGIYEVKKQMIYLDTSVVLSQGKNIVKGDKLVYNVATGQSDITSGTSTSTSTNTEGKKTGGRVKGVFIPQNNSN